MRKNSIIFVILFLIFAAESWSQSWRSTSFDDRPACEKSGGVWRQFGNGCADKCDHKFNKFSICTQALNFACDCGIDSCWNDGKCVDMSYYKKQYDVKQAEEEKKLAAAKEKRLIESKAHSRKMMRNLFTKLNPPQPDKKNKKSQQKKSNKPNSTSKANSSAPTSYKPQPPKQVEIPPYFLKKQEQLEAQKQQQIEQGGSSSSIPEGLPEIPLPN